MNPVLECRQLVTGFAANQVLHGVDLTIEAGQIVGIFGLNGAGKSVTMKTVSGLQPLWSGEIHFDGQPLTGMSPEQRVAAGIGNVPQGRQVFPELTIEENLRLGAYTSRRRDRSRWPAQLDGVYDRFPVLADKRHALAGTLSGGQQASLAVGRALVNEPKLLLIDEPSAGLAPVIVAELLRILQRVAASGMTMLLIEQNVRFGLQLVDQANIMQSGRVVYAGATASLDEERVAAMLGIGRMLRATTTDVLTATEPHAPAPSGERRRRVPLVAPPEAVDEEPATDRPVTKKTGSAKKKAASKKRAATRKKAPAKKRAAPKKRAATKKAATKKTTAKKRKAATKKKGAVKKVTARKKPAAAKKKAAPRKRTR